MAQEHKPLTDKQAMFVKEYKKDKDPEQAAIRAGYSKDNAKVIGEDNLKKPNIAAAIEKALEEPVEKQPKGKGGRKPFEITPEVLANVEKYAAQGLTKEQTAAMLGIAAGTYYEKVKTNPELDETYKIGAKRGIGTIVNALYTSAKDGNLGAQCFYLKNRDSENWKERRTDDVNLNAEGFTMNLNFGGK